MSVSVKQSSVPDENAKRRKSMLDNQKIKEILDVIDGCGTGHGASIDQLKFLQGEIENRIKVTESLSNFTDAVIQEAKRLG